jgi:hypothetical protein
MLGHRPDICYVSQGWIHDGTQPGEVRMNGGTAFPCLIHRFRQLAPAQGAVVVLNYYIVDGQYSPDVYLLRSKAMRGTSGVRYVAQVQVVALTGGRGNPDAAAEAVRAFAADSAKAIRAVMPDALAYPAATAAEPGPSGQPARSGA